MGTYHEQFFLQDWKLLWVSQQVTEEWMNTKA
jgi:hypothetical protein